MAGNKNSGRRRKPDKVHRLEGTFRADRHDTPSIAMQTGGNAPPTPEGLDGEALELWNHVIKTRKEWLAVSDGPALQSLCETWALRCAALGVLEADATAKEPRLAYNGYQSEFARLAGKFGLTPTDRAKQGERSQEEIDPAAEFIA